MTQNFDEIQECPHCQTNKELKADLQFLFSECCGYALCESCTSQVFSKNATLRCPNCNEAVNKRKYSKNRLSTQQFQNEASKRTHIHQSCNLRLEDFNNSIIEWNHYLEFVEDLVYDLSHGTADQRKKAEQTFTEWKAKNRDLIAKNKDREFEENLMNINLNEHGNDNANTNSSTKQTNTNTNDALQNAPVQHPAHAICIDRTESQQNKKRKNGNSTNTNSHVLQSLLNRPNRTTNQYNIAGYNVNIRIQGQTLQQIPNSIGSVSTENTQHKPSIWNQTEALTQHNTLNTNSRKRKFNNTNTNTLPTKKRKMKSRQSPQHLLQNTTTKQPTEANAADTKCGLKRRASSPPAQPQPAAKPQEIAAKKSQSEAPLSRPKPIKYHATTQTDSNVNIDEGNGNERTGPIEEDDQLQNIQSIEKTEWSEKDCAKWVGSLGNAYKQYMESFIHNGIDGGLLGELDHDDLKIITHLKLHRKKILMAWRQLQNTSYNLEAQELNPWK
eukprot:724857_1